MTVRECMLTVSLACGFMMFDSALAGHTQWTLSQKPELLQNLKKLQEKHHQRIEKTKEKIRTTLAASQKVKLDGKSQDMRNIARDLDSLQPQMADLNRKRDLLDRLAQVLESKWYGQNLQEFLSVQLLEIASVDISSSHTAGDSLATFATNLSVAIREIKEPQEDFFEFIDCYLQQSTVVKPMPPEQFLKTRHYTNGVHALQARGVPQELLGEELELHLRRTQAKPSQVLTTTADK
jgi:hypothetical protein